MPKNWRGRLPIPRHANPLVKRLFDVVNQLKISVKELGERSGLNHHTISLWRYSREPTIGNFEAVANAMGYRLVLIPRDFEIDTTNAPAIKLCIRGTPLDLWPSCARLLLCLMGNPRANAELLAEAIWPDADAMPDSWGDAIKVLIHRTRQKLVPHGWDIETEHGWGYRLIEGRRADAPEEMRDAA